MKHPSLFAIVAACIGCSVPDKDAGAPAFDRSAPRVQIVTPERGTIAGDVTRIVVRGTASDDDGDIARVTVNDVLADLAPDGTWVAELVVTPGTSLLHASVIDGQGHRGAATRAVVAGPMAALDRHVPSGIRATVSAQALTALGASTATFIESGGLMTAVQDMNPVVDVGGGPDCLYAQAAVTSLTVANADVQLTPTPEGIVLSAVLDDARIGMRLQWAVTCFDDSRDVVLSAQRVTVQGLLAVGVVERKLDVQLDQPNVQVTGFDAQLPDVPDAIVQLIEIDAAIGPILGLMTERLVVPMVERSLTALDDTKTLTTAGVDVDIDVTPTQINFTSQGGALAFDTLLRARGDNGWFVYVPNPAPALAMKHGFELAVSDDAANQLLTSMWSAKAFDTTIDLGGDGYREIGTYYDSVQLELLVPPHVDAHGSPLQLTVGDWVATFKRRDVVVATVAIHTRSALYVVEGAGGRLRMEVSTPTATVDVIDDVDEITKGELAAIQSFAVEHVTTAGSAAVAAIPLPTVGDAMPTNLWLEPAAGWLLVFGDVH